MAIGSLKLFIAISAFGLCQAYTRPNIVFFLADDIGWSDFGYHGYDLVGATPTIDTMASEGVKLYSVYGQTGCSPGRAAFLAGRYPLRFGMQNGAINVQQRKGIPLNESLISNEMKKAGYMTMAAGKWHVGHAHWDQTPTFRGFDHFYGFMCNGQMDFLTKMNNNYLDLYHDGVPETDEYALSEDTRSSWLYDAAAEDFITNHKTNNPDSPFFIYYALQDPHSPLSSPEYFLESEPCSLISDESRQTYCGMMSCIDSTVQGIMSAISDNGFVGNTLVFFSGDNGGAPKNGGYNWPLRGSKGTLYEGGVRQNSWVWGANLDDNVRGTIYSGAIHLVDFLPTLMSVATGGHWVKPENKSLDGMDVWSAISTGSASPRNITIYNVNGDSGGIRMNDWSLLYNCKEDGWYNPMSSSNAAHGYTPPPASELEKRINLQKDDDNSNGVYLFDLSNDVLQQYDVAESYPEIADEMLAILQVYISEQADVNIDSDKEDEAKEVAAETGYWGPWLTDEEYYGASSQKVQMKKQMNKGSLVNDF